MFFGADVVKMLQRSIMSPWKRVNSFFSVPECELKKAGDVLYFFNTFAAMETTTTNPCTISWAKPITGHINGELG